MKFLYGKRRYEKLHYKNVVKLKYIDIFPLKEVNLDDNLKILWKAF